MTPERPQPPAIIEELNKSLEREDFERMEIPSVESIAEKLGIDANTLYEWVRSDAQFATDLHKVKDVNDQILPEFRFTEEEDRISEDQIAGALDAAMIALVIMETRDRHYKAQNS